MTKYTRLTAAAGLFMGFALCSATAQPVEPWREPQDTAAALLEPDRYAWRLFVALNWPANIATKDADTSKPFGAPGSVVWETWRNVNPLSADTVFRQDGSDPGPWLGTGGPVAVARVERQFDAVPIKQQVFLAARQRSRAASGPILTFDAMVGNLNEVRLNASTYEFIRQNKLFNIQGQVAQFSAGKENLVFPLAAKEVKAQWRKIREADKARYHWAEVTRNNGTKETWGMTALHIITKDLPNWFWATFEHIDNKQTGPLPDPDAPPNVGWLTQSVDRVACPTPPHNCEQAPSGIGLEGTKWANYRLRGTQIDFIDTIGIPTILANSQIESPFQRQSSCITCHARATISRDGTEDAGFFPPSVGPPVPEWFRDPLTRQRIYMQLDFVWSLRRASPASQ
jgi:hypothetical protein